MSVHVLLNLVGEKDKMQDFAEHLIGFFSPTCLINSLIQEHESIYHMTLKSHYFSDFCIKTSKVWQFSHAVCQVVHVSP